MGIDRVMNNPRSTILALLFSLPACASDDDGEAALGGTTEAMAAESSGAMGDTTGSDDSSAPDDDDTASFLEMPDAGSTPSQCDVWADDCPEGEKCMPWANDGGGSWNATRCSPIQSNPDGVGDTCTVEDNGTSGLDSCNARSMCYYVDSETDTGVCVDFCTGTANNPTCAEPDEICTIANDGVLTLCRPSCDPLLQDCVGDAVCMEAPGGQVGFTCMIDISDGDEAPGTPCQYNNSCPPGLTCEPAEGIPGCTDERCCTSWCDLSAADPDEACTLDGQECLAFASDPPPAFGNVGICLLPPS